jgi:hypothetical protein
MQNPMLQLALGYVRQGHPAADEPIAAQGLNAPRDPRNLLGNFWPEDESIDDFLAAMREWRGNTKTSPAE